MVRTAGDPEAGRQAAQAGRQAAGTQQGASDGATPPATGSTRVRRPGRTAPTVASLFGRLLAAGPAEWLHLLSAQRALLAAEWARRRRKTGDLLELSGAAWSADPPSGVTGAGGVPGTPSMPDAESLADARAVSIASRYGVFRPLCLTRSMALQSMLRRRGLHAAVRVGARREDGRLEAHAWVELDGTVLGDTPEHVAGFAPLGDFSRR